MGNTITVGSGAIINPDRHDIDRVVSGDTLGDPNNLLFRDPNHFLAGELHEHPEQWSVIIGAHPTPQQSQVFDWINGKIAIFSYFQHFTGSFKGISYDSDRPPQKAFRNNTSCKPFVDFVRKTLLERLETGAISLLGRVGHVPHPHLLLPLTVEHNKPRLCHDEWLLKLWIVDKSFQLHLLGDLPRCVRNSYQTILDDKSGYDHLLLTEESARSWHTMEWMAVYLQHIAL